MPLYSYSNPKTGEIKDIVQGMNDEHVYIEDGVKWDRVFSKPQASVDTKIDPFSSQDFSNKTSSKKGTLGDIFDLSKEASIKRSEKIGFDPVKEKYYEDYSKKRGGKPHPDKLKSDVTIEI